MPLVDILTFAAVLFPLVAWVTIDVIGYMPKLLRVSLWRWLGAFLLLIAALEPFVIHVLGLQAPQWVGDAWGGLVLTGILLFALTVLVAFACFFNAECILSPPTEEENQRNTED